ncbi:PfkB family carbohydrate kinase [Agromyces seonyuensis]|uniref:Carbohydrate kinase n=1 Tax=Agromyces seonyuensis TaxID=2662446 RepID=A0A6I4P7N2_9MICO|nr:carbohydrate kinase [Agromyces seonyuensis]
MSQQSGSGAGTGVRHEVLVVGEALVDVVHRRSGVVDEAPGGSPANVALTLGRLGRRVGLATSLGDDERGRAVREWLAESGVEASHVGEQAGRAARTSTATAILDETGAARYEFDLDWVLDAAALEESAAAGGASHVHVGSAGVSLEPGAAVVERFVAGRRSEATVTFDPNVRPSLVDDEAAVRAGIHRVAALADLVKASDEDLAWLAPGAEPLDTARAWCAAGVPVVVVTRGAAGLWASTPAGEIAIAAPRVEVADTVGAGDTVMGALIDALVGHGLTGPEGRDGWAGVTAGDWARMLARAAAAAAITVSRPGADPPNRAELDERLRPA